MAQQARVTSLEALKEFYVTLVRCVDDSKAALTSCDMQARRALDTIVHEKKAHWERALKQRQEELSQARLQLKARQNSPGKKDTTEQELALKRAEARVREAEEKLEAVRKWSRALEKAIEEYMSKSRRFRDLVEGDPAKIISAMDRINTSLDSYVELRSGMPTTAGGGKRGGAGPGGGDGAGGPLQVDPRALRDSTPTIDGRNRALGGTWAATGGEAAAEPSLALELGQSPQLPRNDAGVTVDVHALRAGTFYVERVTSGLGKDSGWHLGGLTGGQAEALETHSVAMLIDRYPVLAQLFALATGTLAVVQRGRLEKVFDSRNAPLVGGDVEALPPAE